MERETLEIGVRTRLQLGVGVGQPKLTPPVLVVFDHDRQVGTIGRNRYLGFGLRIAVRLALADIVAVLLISTP